MLPIESIVYLLLVLQFCIQLCITYKTVDESVMFRIDWKGNAATPKYLVDVKDDWLTNQPYLHITSGNDEKYLCTLPIIPAQSKETLQSYVGPSPAELIQTLYDNRVCSYWLDVYWTYELCHGRYVMQYHDNREMQRNSRSEYYLGNYGREQSKLDDKNFDELNPPKRKIDNKEQPYYPVTYRQGTVCDLTGKPRNTVVIYVCEPDAKDQIYSFAETASCTYEMVVFTKQLCSHPSFRPLPAVDHEIVCYSKDPHKEFAKPEQLLQLEKESEAALEREYKSTLQLEKPSANIDINRNEEMEDYDDDLDTTVIMPKQTSRKSDVLKHAPSAISTEKPMTDINSLLEENRYLLNGKHCLYGGGLGWWKYEFCFGKSVIQFHDSAQGDRVEVLLGLFNLDIHKHWIDDNPQKKPLKIDGRVTQVSHLYAGGAFCEETNIHRSVEVRIRCRMSKGSQTAVTLYLLEPQTCQYVLGVESSRFCDLLQTADQYGLIHLPEI
uniref:Endoplasmic reticulum lectin 1 n=1 Tax=Setaria digitata TaxID=48799 RepID=A0A915PUF4_9BILA